MAASGYEAGHSMGNKMASDEDGEMYDESGDSLDDVPF
jgi:hypothetical protein